MGIFRRATIAAKEGSEGGAPSLSFTERSKSESLQPANPTSMSTVLDSTAEPRSRTHGEPAGRNQGRFRDCYTVGEVLGMGAFSVVRSAVHKRSGALCAVKMFFKDKSGRDSALLEIALLQEAAHDSVLRFVEYFEEAGGMYVVTELVPGRDAQTCLNERGSYAEEDCRTIARQLLSALKHCHSRGIAHRDIKPDNLVFGESDCLSSLKLIDFGLASQLSSDKPHFTRPCGTPAYAAPEVLVQNARYGTSCDLWSTGCLIFMLLSGEPPFTVRATGLRDLVLRIRRADYSMADPAWELVSDEAKNFVRTLLTVDPAVRPTAAAALQHPWLQN